LQTSSSSGCDEKKVVRQCASRLEIRITDVILATCDWFISLFPTGYETKVEISLFSIRKILGSSNTKCTTPAKIDWNMLLTFT